MNLKGKTAVVTGAAGGIGSELIGVLRDEGVGLVLIEKKLTFFERLTDILDGPQIAKFECDLSSTQNVLDLAKEISEKYPKIDFLFNVAGIGIYKSLEELSLSDWFNSYSINIHTPFIFTKGLMSSLKRSGNALVFNIGSGMGVIAEAGRSAYCSTKFALRGLTLSLSKEYQGQEVDFCLLTLGSVMTPFGTDGLTKRKKLAAQGKDYLTPQEVAQKVLEIVKDDNRDEEYVFYPKGYAGSY